MPEPITGTGAAVNAGAAAQVESFGPYALKVIDPPESVPAVSAAMSPSAVPTKPDEGALVVSDVVRLSRIATLSVVGPPVSVTRSGRPSPLRSPTASALRGNTELKSWWVSKLSALAPAGVVFTRTEVSPPFDASTMSGLPSPFTSARATAAELGSAVGTSCSFANVNVPASAAVVSANTPT